MGTDKKKRIIPIIVVLILLLFIIGGGLVYGAFYHADIVALNVIDDPPEDVVVTECTDGDMIFRPTGEHENIGLIFYPGAMVEHDAYAPLLAKLASGGITCFLAEMPSSLAFFDVNKAEKILDNHPEIDEWYIGGHSLGGCTAAMYVADNPDSFSGLILLGAYSIDDISLSDIKVLSIYGSEDGVINRNAYEDNRKNLPTDYTEFVIEGGNHSQFGNYGNQDRDGSASITWQEQQDITVNMVENFIFREQ